MSIVASYEWCEKAVGSVPPSRIFSSNVSDPSALTDSGTVMYIPSTVSSRGLMNSSCDWKPSLRTQSPP